MVAVGEGRVMMSSVLVVLTGIKLIIAAPPETVLEAETEYLEISNISSSLMRSFTTCCDRGSCYSSSVTASCCGISTVIQILRESL